MPIRYLPLIFIGTGLLCSGCTVFRDFGRTTFTEPVHFATQVDHVRLHIHANRAAEKAWVEMYGTKGKHSDDFRKGFIDGFADYLQYGGNGEPPSVPPREYWKEDSVPGRQASQEWSAGFRHGAAQAKRSGIRDLIVVSLTGPGISPSSHGPRGNGPSPETDVPPPALPFPRVMDADKGPP